MDVQQLEESWAARAGAREARLVAASHVPAALSLLGSVRPSDRLVVFADDFADAFARGFDACDVVLVGEPSVAAFAAASEGFATAFDAEVPHLWWFVNSIGGFGLRVPDLRALGRAAREAHALLGEDNTVAAAFGCDPLRLGAAPFWEGLGQVYLKFLQPLYQRFPALIERVRRHGKHASPRQLADVLGKLLCIIPRPLAAAAGLV